MGQGNIKYRKVKRTPQTGENAGKELWYATVVTDREMNFEEFVDHISSHNSPYSRGTVHGVMMDMLDCLKELILDGKSVRLGDLGLFSIGMSSRGEVSRDKVTSASVEGIHLLVKNTKNWSNSELKKLCKITAYEPVEAKRTAAEPPLAAVLTKVAAATPRVAEPLVELAAKARVELAAKAQVATLARAAEPVTEPEAMAITSTSLCRVSPFGGYSSILSHR